jgi:DNA-binding transcriptional MerR regulator
MKILNVQGLAKAIGVSRQTIHTLLSQKKIKPDYVDNAGHRFFKSAEAAKIKERAICRSSSSPPNPPIS